MVVATVAATSLTADESTRSIVMAGPAGGIQAAAQRRAQLGVNPTLVQAGNTQQFTQFAGAGDPIVDGNVAQTIANTVGNAARQTAAGMSFQPLNVQAAQIGSQGYNAAQAAAQTAGSQGYTAGGYNAQNAAAQQAAAQNAATYTAGSQGYNATQGAAQQAAVSQAGSQGYNAAQAGTSGYDAARAAAERATGA